MWCFLFWFVFWCQMCGAEVEYIKYIYDTIPPRYSMKQSSSLLGASLKEGSPLYYRPMYFVMKEHQVPS